MEELTAQQVVELLGLQPHPEGGYYSETYRSKTIFEHGDVFPATRNHSTAIYYLLENTDFSTFHRIKSDELWHHYLGQSFLISVIHEDGRFEEILLGKNLQHGEKLQAMVPAGAWFASELKTKAGFGLVGCTVAPGFDFQDFEIAKRDELIELYPELAQTISRLSRL